MDITAYTAASRQLALQRRMDVIANNVANMATTGFKAEIARFDAVMEDAGEPGDVAFVQDRGLLRDTSSGPIATTGNPLDLAISGEGYFAIQTADGPAYSRDGHFSLSATGEIVNAQGLPVLSNAGAPIVVPPDAGKLAIARDGTISVEGGALDRIGVVSFADEQAMRRAGSSLLTTDEAPVPLERPDLVQGALESSNVIAVFEMTALIEVSRAFQDTQKMIEAHHDLERRTIEQVIGSDNG